MTVTTADLTCARCHGPTSRGTMVYTLLRSAQGSASVTDLHPDFVFCSDTCAMGSVVAAVRQATCRTCGRKHDRPIGSATQVYCDDKCKASFERILRRAARDLAKSVKAAGTLDKLDQQIGEATALWGHWKEGGDLLPCPHLKAAQALKGRIENLARDRDKLLAKLEADAKAERHAKNLEADRALMEHRAEADRQWREMLS